MLHAQPRGKGDGAFQRFPGASRQAQHQVQGDVCKAGSPGVFHSQGGVLGGMGTAQQPQLGWVGGLQPHGQPVEPGFPHLFKKVPIHVGGVGFQGDLRCVGQGKALFHPLEEGPQPGGPQKTGGPPAKVDRGKLPVPELVPPGGQGGENSLYIGVRILLGIGEGVEVTVRAFAVAEGDMEVKAKHGITTNG